MRRLDLVSGIYLSFLCFRGCVCEFVYASCLAVWCRVGCRQRILDNPRSRLYAQAFHATRLPSIPRMLWRFSSRRAGSCVRSTLFSTAVKTRRCSLLSASKSSSSCLCHGYNTPTWKLSAELATTKLVIERARVMIMVTGKSLLLGCYDVEVEVGTAADTEANTLR